MAMASAGTKIVPESSSKLMEGLNLTILPSDCAEARVDGTQFPAAKAGYQQSSSNLFSSRIPARAPKGISLHSIDLYSDESSASACSSKGKLPVVLEESESLSHSEASSMWDTSSSSISSITSSSASSCSLQRGASAGGRKSKKPWKLRKRRDRKETSLLSLLLWPLKKVRDGYMSCMTGLDGVGDLSGLAQGSTFATSSKYFADMPMSKTDASNHG